ncbi:hypothetical protein [Streptomyces mangrovisoli]|uniref:DUF2254 domain-containing protein n=1 Tax=Streptomyces mangrovisoli TaxID=1428628 RepID=A0A1J4NM74_9ACTN|nr:hypothetical protein [Streptomyces mangrovisoli]OIJ63431.1 hypothetical protein WN71_034285 [Streptomyces mangrovisoli]
MSVRESLVDRWSEAVWWDYVIALVAVSAHVAIVRAMGRGDWLSWIDSEQRVSLYGTAAGVVSAIGGLSSIAISIYLSSNGERIRAVRRHYQQELRRNWKSLLTATALICVGCLAAQSLDNKADTHSARYLFEAVMALAVIRFLRMLWLLDSMMTVNDRDQSDPPAQPAPRFDPGWRRQRRSPSA